MNESPPVRFDLPHALLVGNLVTLFDDEMLSRGPTILLDLKAVVELHRQLGVIIEHAWRGVDRSTD